MLWEGPKTEPPKGPGFPIIIEMPFSGESKKGLFAGAAPGEADALIYHACASKNEFWN